MKLPGWVQVRAGKSTGKGKMLRWPRTWLGEAVCLRDRTVFQFRFAVPTLILGGDLRQRGAFVRDGVYFILWPGLRFLFGFRRVACQY